ncbi:MAG: sigma-70 family RNA polymerase sigma factor [Planctomycetia bacterium]|nr:sigma-70 family RNA polymerase sigma factor [Planctomycetia bacterium]
MSTPDESRVAPPSGPAHGVPTSPPAGDPRDADGLVARLQRGDDAAFETLVRMHGPRMLAVARRYLPQDADAQDALQDAFVNVARAIGGFEGASRLETWLHRIVVNAALMKLRARSRRPEVSVDEEALARIERSRGPSGWSSTADEALSRRELEEIVRDEVARLPDDYRAVLVLRDVEGLGVDEIAALLDVGAAAAKMRLQHARRMLRAALGARLTPSEAP